MTVAFCDDDPSVLQDAAKLLDSYCLHRDVELTYAAYQSPLDLLAEVERGGRLDVLFLDVLMPGQNGIETASELRKYDEDVKIIFLTSSAEFAVQSYTVNAYYYLLKPVQEDSFFQLMDSVLAACQQERTDSLILRCKSGITRVPLRQLEYCEVIGRTLLFHLTTGRVLESNGSMDELSQQLESFGNFLRVHRSYLVNLDRVQSISSHAVTMSCLTDIPIPRGKFHRIKDAYLEHIFSGRERRGLLDRISE